MENANFSGKDENLVSLENSTRNLTVPHKTCVVLMSYEVLLEAIDQCFSEFTDSVWYLFLCSYLVRCHLMKDRDVTKAKSRFSRLLNANHVPFWENLWPALKRA